MHLAEMDLLANKGQSFFHRAGVISKLLFTVLMLTAIIIANKPGILIFLAAVLIFIFLLARIPLLKVIHLALYPAFFSLLFAMIKFQDSLTAGLIVILKAVAAALAMILLISTTPYIDIFACLSAVLPRILVDIFFFTYRSVFILLERAENLFKSIRLRGGYSPLALVLNFRNVSQIIGALIIHSFEMGERMYKIFSLRGFNGYIHLEVKWLPLSRSDIIIIVMGVLIFMGTVIPWNPW